MCGGLQPRRPLLTLGDPMSNDVLRFEVGTATEFETLGGQRYIRGSVGGLCFTLLPKPDREPEAGGLLRYAILISPQPGKARHVVTPAPQRAPAEPKKVIAPKSTETAGATEVIARHGAIPNGGDPLDDLFPAPAEAAPDDVPSDTGAEELLFRPVC